MIEQNNTPFTVCAHKRAKSINLKPEKFRNIRERTLVHRFIFDSVVITVRQLKIYAHVYNRRYACGFV